MTKTSVEKSFCTTREAADLLGVSVGTVQLWVESGMLQAWKTAGGHRRVLRDSVDGLLRNTPARAPSTETVSSSALLPPEGPRRLTVMVVEDDVHLLRLYETRISAWPMKPVVLAVDSAVAALVILGRASPDILITDLHMPGMDGFEMLRVLSRMPEVRHMTIAVVSGLDATEIEARGGLPAEIEVLPKPIPFGRLLELAEVAVTLSKFRLQPNQLKADAESPPPQM